MTGDKWIKLEDLREPGMRRVIEAMMHVTQERRADERHADMPAGVLARGAKPEGGRLGA